ncbi:hypothetical protein [Novosphingobium album (ex Liu et al. 2023)]|uniref:DUF4189 domain-containing protein n=1 Tax=Novosphingobium album (ex Liu et al. 2023) TaxID=3031130 RepID=A0ABT5WSU6_9SPHN|nr:hypothetical protein [Novosphingobium album (ex Liu et al. 2023)]MDE8653102.1 hypothetical protein [Novosphingobium album (ex Liu et al. 2023)]
MISLSLLALSFAVTPLAPAAAPTQAVAAYGCRVVAGQQAPACGASPMIVAQGKGAVAGHRDQARKVARAEAATCHPDPGKGRACRHHNLQLESGAQDGTALALQDRAR